MLFLTYEDEQDWIGNDESDIIDDDDSDCYCE